MIARTAGGDLAQRRAFGVGLEARGEDAKDNGEQDRTDDHRDHSSTQFGEHRDADPQAQQGNTDAKNRARGEVEACSGLRVFGQEVQRKQRQAERKALGLALGRSLKHWMRLPSSLPKPVNHW